MQKKIEQTIQILNDFIKAYSNFDITSMNQYLDDNVEYKNISHGELVEFSSGLIEFALIIEQSKILFSKRDIEIQGVNINKTQIDTDTIINATMAIGTPDGLKAGQKIAYKAKFNFYIENLKIKKISVIS